MATVREPVVSPRIAMLAGLLPLRSIGVDSFRLNYPEYDGRGVLIGILDGGIDAGIPGLRGTTTDLPKILDLRDFSGEGRVPLQRLDRPNSDTVLVGGHRLTGFGRLARLAAPPYYWGIFRELPLGTLPAADVNGNGENTDEFPVIVAKAAGGWIAVTDTDGDGSLSDEGPIRDFAVARETFSFHTASAPDGRGPMTIAVNFGDDEGWPIVDFVFDNSGHGTHVAGVAAGHDMFGVDGFDGVAPGAQLLGLKIANNARGGISVTGSLLRAMNYAADYAQQRDLPLVLNLSYGVGNEMEGTAAIDSIVNEFALKHPNVLFVIAAGNDGPGLSTVGFPGSAEYALSVCALFPGVFVQPPQPDVTPARDVVSWWSARGGEVTKPDVCAAGVAFSIVPPWRTGEEIQPGTSFATPQIAGAAALLQSALLDRGRTARAVDLARALMNTATPPVGATRLDAGAGVPNVGAALQWLLAAHQAGVYSVRALPDGGNTSQGSAAYRRAGFLSQADTLQRFVVTSVGGQPAARLVLRSDAEWIEAPDMIEPRGEPVTVTLKLDIAKLSRPGLHVGTVWARPATDTMAGPSFALTNTVVVPHSLAAPFRVNDTVGPGRVRRYFFSVPQSSGGLVTRLAVQRPTDQATLYLFEPNGRPNRGVSNAAAGRADPLSVTLHVGAEDLIPGVYEVVVVAPPTAWVSYELEVALPQVAVVALDDGPAATVRNVSRSRVRAIVSGEHIGAVRSIHVAGRRSDPQFVTVSPPPPEWADRMVVDVVLPGEYWNQITDFGVTVFDSSGAKVSDGPMDYAFGRQTIRLDSLQYDGELTIELLPAYAHLEPPATWTAEVEVRLLSPEPSSLVIAGSSSRIGVVLAPGAVRTIRFDLAPEAHRVPQGFVPLVEVTARTPDGAASVRRGAAAPRDAGT